MNGSNWISVGAVLAALAVIIGAFAAHALKGRLDEYALGVFRTGVEYHFYHALGIILIGAIMLIKPATLLTWAAATMLVGIVLFSGSLYALALSGVRILGAITPLGGLLFISGWVLLAIAAHKM